MEINIVKHESILNTGKVKIKALKNSNIEGYYLKGDILTVVRVVGSLLKVKTEQGFYTYINHINAKILTKK